MDDERAFAMMKRENSESYGNNAPADAGVIAGLLAGYVDGRLKLEDVAASANLHTIYLATRKNGKLKIVGPGGEEVKEARRARSGHAFTTHTLAEHLGWIKANEAATRSTDRFHIAFKALTELILPGAATPSELEGLNQRIINDVAEGVNKVGGD
jgi:hypothetical protein